MKRITTQEVLEAYEKTGLKPKQGAFFPKEGCACAMGAIAKLRFNADSNMVATDLLLEKYDEWYIAGYGNGFDNDFIRGTRDKYKVGYKDGKDAWEAVKHLVEVPHETIR